MGRIIGSDTAGNVCRPSLNNMILVKVLSHNLLSMCKLRNNDYDFVFNQNSFKVISQKHGCVILILEQGETKLIKSSCLTLKNKRKNVYVNEQREMNVAQTIRTC